MRDFIIMKKIKGLGYRFLDGPEKPYRWVKDSGEAYRFSSPSDLAEELEAEAVEV